MLHTNLSGRPFYNERLVSLTLVAVALGLAALTAFNATRVMRLSEARANFERDIARDRSEAERIRADAQAVGTGIDPARLPLLAGGAAEANDLITRRTFSWTEFFDVVEGALPYEARLVGVAHMLDGDAQLLVLNLVAQSDAVLNEFVRAMLETGVFYDVLPTEKSRNRDDGTMGAIIETYYLPSGRQVRGVEANGGRP